MFNILKYDLHNELHNDLLFYLNKWKLAWEKRIRDTLKNLKQTLNHGLTLKKMHRLIKLNQGTWLKLYTD